jgi:two-component system, LytTR family, response regulator
MGEPTHIRTLVVDDEPLAREGLRLLLASDPDVEVVGEATSGRDALGAVRRLRPDLVFLDVQMPEMNGFDVLAALQAAGETNLPAVIFVTAYDRYALRAFEVHALDYLLKPFDDERFADALERAKRHLRLTHVSSLSERLLSLLETYRGPDGTREYMTRLSIKDAGRVLFLDVAEVDWIEAADYYVQLHVGGKSYLHRESMQRLEERLDPGRFLRIHRSAIVNRQRVKELRHKGRELHCVLASGVSLKVARSQRAKLSKML